MKKLLALIMALALAMSMVACGSSESAAQEEEKKALPVTTPEPETSAEPLYKDIMVPYSEIQHGKRIIILQNTLVFSRAGVFTEAETPVAETVSYNGAEYMAYPMSAVTKFLIEENSAGVTVYTTDGESSLLTGADFENSKILIDDFQSGNSPIILSSAGFEIQNFDYALLANGEVIASIITEQEYNVNEHLVKYGWDNTKTYNLVATDVFYIPITPEDYDEGGLRGALSGAINANFPDMIIATGKLNDVVFIEEIVG